MLARLICFLLGHIYDARLFLPQPGVRIRRSECARCGAITIEILDSHEDEGFVHAVPTEDALKTPVRRGPLDTR